MQKADGLGGREWEAGWGWVQHLGAVAPGEAAPPWTGAPEQGMARRMLLPPAAASLCHLMLYFLAPSLSLQTQGAHCQGTALLFSNSESRTQTLDSHQL